MRVGMVGLGRMGAKRARRLLRGGHQVVASDRSPDAASDMAKEGAIAPSSFDDFCSRLAGLRIAWLMIPAGEATETTAPALAGHMRQDDILIDGGNSYFKDNTALTVTENPTPREYSGYVQDSGEGRWTIEAAIEEAVPVDELSPAQFMRFRSREEHPFAEKMLSAMRQKFGGHFEPMVETKSA